MAEGVVSVVAESLSQVGSRLLLENELASGVKVEIEKLMLTVRAIQAVLADAEERHSKEDGQATEWLQRIKDAFYEADDLLDDFATQLKQREVMTGNKMTKEVRVFFSNSNQIAYGFKMAYKIKAVRVKLEEIKNDRHFHLNEHLSEKREESREREQTHSFVGEEIKNDRQFHLTENLAETRVESIERKQTKSFVGEEWVIGREDPKKEIIKLLLEPNDQDENVSVIPIVGMGGMGKTTLARLVYNDEQVKNHFDLRIWVCVSAQFEVERIMESIITSASHKELEKLEIDQLQERLHKEIDTKKYLLVLDDIWEKDEAKWAKLNDHLRKGIKGSKIVVTTRLQEVANITSKRSPFILQALDEDYSWSLLTESIFKSRIELKDSRLIKIGKEILRKCGGLPLAIRVIGGELSRNITEEHWSRLNDQLSKLNEENGILQVLKNSYDYLPSHLKQCFAYCAIFPEDYEINKQKLISLWMAQGFLQSSNNARCLKEVGNEYFMDLLSRGFFGGSKYDEYGNLITCRMHDKILELAKSVSREECTMTILKTNKIVRRYRHLSLDCGHSNPSWKFSKELLSVRHIRTLLLLVQPDAYSKLDDQYEIFSNYRYLRSLDLSKFSFKKLLCSIDKLKHLRYLNLSENYFIKRLPNSILRLRNLETLDLSYCGSLIELPKNIRKMMNLKDLLIEGCNSLIGMPHGLGKLTNLQTLPLFVVSKRNNEASNKYGALDELYGLNKLSGSLRIENLGHVKNARLVKVLEMEFLRFLTLKWGWSRSETYVSHEVVLEGLKPHANLKAIKIDDFMGLKLSSWVSMTSLTSISLSNCMRCQHLPRLDQLPSLNSFYLIGLNDLEYVDQARNDCCSTPFFPSLKHLTLLECPKLKEWWRRDDEERTQMKELSSLPSFPCLSKLFVEDCPKLTSMPLYPSVEELKLVNTSSMPLQRTIMLTSSVGPSTSSSFSAPLSKLKSLLFKKVTDLESLAEKQLPKLISLVDLTILSCQTLSRLPRGIGNLTSLEKLQIESCHNFCGDEEDDDEQWQELASLRFVKFYWLQKLKSLPKGLQHVKCLEYLNIEECPNLTALPEWMDKLTSLKTLRISDCPYLSETCGNQRRQDWKKIGKISNIRVDSKWIQSEGKYLLNKEESSSKASTFSPYRVLKDSQGAE